MSFSDNNPYLRRLDQIEAARKEFKEVNWRLSFLRSVPAKPSPDPTDDQILKWFGERPTKFRIDGIGHAGMSNRAATPNNWFKERFETQIEQYGPIFLELRESSMNGFTRVTPASLNHDTCAAILSDTGLGMSTIYYPGEMEWYYLEPIEKIYKTTTPERLQCLYRGLMMRCYLEVNDDTNKFSLFHQFRDEPTSKIVVNRAKNILASNEYFFAADSPNTRQQGPELPERLGRVFVESMLEKRDGSLLTLTQAYNLFSQLSLQRNLAPIKRATFKEMMRDMMKEAFGICLRNDVPDQNNKQQMGWKGVAVNLGSEDKAEAA